ncbi:hypothetical protein ACFYZ8_36850 [Streptomyces sp. NPDC001668]|uniref:hypothetical protein n=1 Tax=unclassified Streptomyces TaxID=2593676 RepID=UPI003674C6B8
MTTKVPRGGRTVTRGGFATAKTVRANRSFGGTARTHNLTVDDLHTFYVFAGRTPVLVHNATCKVAWLSGKLPAAGESVLNDRRDVLHLDTPWRRG